MRENSLLVSVIGFLVALGVVVVVFIGYIFYITFCIHTLYGWFLLPLGMPVIMFWQMYGITLFLRIILPSSYLIPKDINEKKTIYAILTAPGISLIMGYIIHLFLI